jgi:hypothetical protein
MEGHPASGRVAFDASGSDQSSAPTETKEGHTMADTPSRPFGVTVVFILILIVGVLGLVAGVLVLFDRGENQAVGWTYGLLTIAISAIYLLVARGIAGGSRVSRLIVGLITLLSLAGGIWVAIVASGSRTTGLIQAGFALLILFLLYNARASRFFHA